MADTVKLESGEVLDLSAYPLPDGVEDMVVSQKLIAKGLNVSVVTIAKYIDDGMPVKKAGGNGVEYEFQLSHCYAWKLWRKAEAEARDKLESDNAAQLALTFLGGDDEVDASRAALSPKQMREYSEAELVRNKAAEQRGELVRVRDVQMAVEDVLSVFRGALTGLPDWMESEFSLSPSQVEKAETYCDGVLVQCRHRIADGGLNDGEVVPLTRDEGATV